MLLTNRSLSDSEFLNALNIRDSYSNITEDDLCYIYKRYQKIVTTQQLDVDHDITVLEDLIGDYSKHAYSLQTRLVCKKSLHPGNCRFFVLRHNMSILFPEYFYLYIVAGVTAGHEEAKRFLISLEHDAANILLQHNNVNNIMTLEKANKVIDFLEEFASEYPSDDWDLILQVLNRRPASATALLIRELGTIHHIESTFDEEVTLW